MPGKRRQASRADLRTTHRSRVDHEDEHDVVGYEVGAHASIVLGPADVLGHSLVGMGTLRLDRRSSWERGQRHLLHSRIGCLRATDALQLMTHAGRWIGLERWRSGPLATLQITG